MMFRTHVVFSLFLALFYLSFYPVSNLFLFFVCFFVGMCVPDLDNPVSKIGRKFKITSNLIRFMFGHRGIFHSFLFLILLFVVLKFFNNLVAFYMCIGYLTHLIGDAFTLEGVNLFYPLKFKIKGFLRTDGAIEYALFIFLLVVDVLKIKSLLV